MTHAQKTQMDSAPLDLIPENDSISRDLLYENHAQLKVVFGSKKMVITDILKLQHGSIIELDRYDDDEIDLYVNDICVAKGKMVVLNDENMAFVITKILNS